MSIIDVNENQPDSFRMKLSNIDNQGRRSKIYPQKTSGFYTTWRNRVSYVLLVFLFVAPWIRLNGEQFMLFNILERKFIVAGVIFFPQDFYIVVLGILTLLTSIVLFTAILGRIWCGWLCPQTIFLEMVFRKLERAIEGNHVQQKLLDSAPLSTQKFLKKAIKHSIFYTISFAVGNTFLAYIIGTDELRKIITDPPSQHIVGLVSMILFSLTFYAVFARFREQACVVVCPYGRYQSALVDQSTILVTYDFPRGEPRGKFTAKDKLVTSDVSSRGDCIDCHQCVTVCPTGIDIRNGIQLDCVNCTACIDACDTIMTKINKPTGLIRYASLDAITTNDSTYTWLTTRVKSYSAVWLVVMSLFLYFFAMRPMTEVLILRQAGMMAVESSNGDLVNFYTMQIVNKQHNSRHIDVRLNNPTTGQLQILGDITAIKPISEKSVRLMVTLPAHKQQTNIPIEFSLYEDGKQIKQISSSFLTIQSNVGK